MRVKLDAVAILLKSTRSIWILVSSTLANKNVVINSYINFPGETSITGSDVESNMNKCKVSILLTFQTNIGRRAH